MCCKKVTLNSFEIRKSPFLIQLHKRKGDIAKYPPDGNRGSMHRAVLYLGRKFGGRAERKRKLALRDEK